ncbi:MAG: MBL fold metallo-hydrolase [Candidatus Dormibacteria bacterium]
MSEVVFLGTAGARFMVARQLLASGGLWLELAGVQVSLDPGPGALVHARRRGLDPQKLTAIVVSHRHLDHCNDVNAMTEAMTDGGFRPRGSVHLPGDALDSDPVMLQYVQRYPSEVVRLEPESEFQLGPVTVRTSRAHPHSGVETYGLVFTWPGGSMGYVVDSRYYEGMATEHAAGTMIIHCVLRERRPIDHLCLDDARAIVAEARPPLTVLSHFGMTMWDAKPWELAEQMAQDTGCRVIAARDGMRIDLDRCEVLPERRAAT